MTYFSSGKSIDLSKSCTNFGFYTVNKQLAPAEKKNPNKPANNTRHKTKIINFFIRIHTYLSNG